MRKRAKLSMVMFALAALSWGFGCNNETELQLRREVETLKAQVHNLEQRADELDAVKAELLNPPTAQSPSLPTSADAKPITAMRYAPDGSEVDDPYLGRTDAPVLFMEFADYQCKPCGQFYQNSFGKLRQEFIDTGKVKFVYRDFPLATNAYAQAAGRVAHCAGEQGLYWEMYGFLFEHAELVRSGAFEEGETISARLDKDKFRSCTKSTRYVEEIAQDTEDGVRLGVHGAPAFFIGKRTANGAFSGVLVRGAQPLGVFRAEIAKLLEKP